MSIEAPITHDDEWFVGEDKIIGPFYILKGNDVTARSDAAKNATTIEVAALTETLTSGARIRFGAGGGANGGAGVIATLSATAAIGDTSLAVGALPGSIERRTVGREIQDLTGYTMEWVLREGPTGATALLTKTVGSGITITSEVDGVCQVAVDDTDTVDGSGNILIQPGEYYHTLRKTNVDDESVLAYGKAVLRLGATR